MKMAGSCDAKRTPRVRSKTPLAPRAISFPSALFHAAACWFLIGCLGLLWAVVFDVGASMLQLALAAWATLFLLPATIAAIIAYRMDEIDPAPCRRRGARDQDGRAFRRAGQH
jgi:hypothetical protein